MYVVNVSDDELFHQVVDRVRPDVIVHLAAQAGVRYANHFPRRCFESNVLGSQRVFDAAARHDVRRVVYASSSSVYGNIEGECREDDARVAPRSLYGVSKRTVELLAQSFGQVTGLPTIGARLFTTYGDWGRPDMAYFRLLVAAHRDREFPLLADRNVRRDFTFIDDVVSSLRALVERDRPSDDPSMIVNVGGGSPHTMSELIETVESVVGKPVRCQAGEHTPGDVVATFASTLRQREMELPVPAVDLRTGLELTNQWLLRHMVASERWSQWSDRLDNVTTVPTS